jgi:hypothetical protein
MEAAKRPPGATRRSPLNIPSATRARRLAAQTTSRLLTRPPFMEAAMSARLDITGQRFGLLTATRLSHVQKGKTYWLCQCACGTERIILRTNLIRITRSCGCARLGHANRFTHRRTKSPIYRSWQAMKWRCLNPKTRSFQNYGALGVTVCERWCNSFETFLADMGERPPGKTLDRIDPHGNYEPGNCRWATPLEQRHNQRRH